MAIYMEYEGLKGNVTAAGYEGMIRLDFAVLRATRDVSMTAGQLANREFTLPKFGVVETGKRLDGSTVGILRECVAGAGGKSVKLHFVYTGHNQLQEFMTYSFRHCLPTYYRCVATKREGGVPAERLYFSYSRVEVSYRTRGADNKTATTERVGYDVVAAKRL